ncbi:tyrosine-protein phosphatase 1-like [Oppia nitens]|uniref:tyrosine-protein phosphatase 1-like n=1 Tax=Oppia nitens TaxID=1686743 RepID=UPI0023DAB7F4|nr:tyrosine-protein phosphatase 1-like [Oppia nitens]
MSRSFAGLSGTYNVRANELALQKNVRTIRCLVYFLDETQHVFEVDRREKGELLLDLVFRHLELIERDYFGLQFSDGSDCLRHRWLDPSKRIRKQLKAGAPYLLHFRVKFYVSDPSRLLEEYTRYHFFLQIRRDLMSGRVRPNGNQLSILASFAAQSEFGDFSPEEHRNGYTVSLRMTSNPNPDFEESVRELHRMHFGQTPADAELHFLEEARNLELYGVELHRAKDSGGRDIQLGVSGNGLSVLINGQLINRFFWAKIVKISFKRRHFFIQLRREGMDSELDSVLGFNIGSYASCKALWKCCVEQHTFFRLQTPKPHTKKFFFFLSLGSRFRYSGKTEFQTLEENRKRLSARSDRAFVRTRTSRFTRQTVPTPHVHNLGLSSLSNGKHETFTSRVSSASPSPKSAWKSQQSITPSAAAYSPSQIKSLPFIDAEHRLSTALSDDSSPVHVVSISMRPDFDGRFGFNVKGGHDQNCPVLVSRVAPNTPADSANPQLREGDQVLQINGQDVSGLAHERIVQLIRSTRDQGPDAQLTLAIRPNVYAREVAEEPAFQYIPADVSPTSRPPNSALDESMALLAEGLDSGSLVLQFEQLHRKKSGESTSCARLGDNLAKNRYRDISPYDSTRVVLNDGLSGDYINASFVSMEINETINRYIATQGPLKETTEDFWQMIWEQNSPLIVMVTPLEEKGRKKCHKYWPELDDQLTVFGQLKVRLIGQSDDPAIVERTFLLQDSKEERQVRHLQYLAWPDHGVPERDHDFLELIQSVRRTRQQFPVSPFVVHCSAGIGRTGVLILMETAMCLIEANEAVYPLDLVSTMRDQRAMLIQTSAQFRFVCESVLRVFRERIVDLFVN